ncbi:RDD family protein [Nocardiopsis sediminis]|uniref:RDD family protein n=1 Tax=Nocardiopsis sediminis TaxID=1778267 RepID=A0ABV8FQ37_9ACTN
MSTPAWNDPQAGYGQPQYGYGGQPEYGHAPGYAAAPGYGPYTGYAPPGPPMSPHGRLLADWPSRAGAALLDALIVFLVILAILAVGMGGSAGLAYLIDPVGFAERPPVLFIIGSIVSFLAAFAFGLCYRWLHHARTGQTPGKRWMKIQVVSLETGLPPTKGRSFLRELLYAVLGQISVIGLLDILWPLWDDQRQTIHDKVGSTVVVTVLPPPAAPHAQAAV